MSNQGHFLQNFTPDNFVGSINVVHNAKHTRQQTACKAFTVKWCDSCNEAWEGERNTDYYGSDFPKRGLVHKTCPVCARGIK